MKKCISPAALHAEVLNRIKELYVSAQRTCWELLSATHTKFNLNTCKIVWDLTIFVFAKIELLRKPYRIGLAPKLNLL